jgi:hypothetical protein
MDVLTALVPLCFGLVVFGLLLLLTVLVEHASPGARPVSDSARTT